jgi:hypothetical protein
MILRQCKCGTTAYTEEDLSLFSKNPACKYGRAHECITCYNTRKKQWASNNYDKVRDKDVKYLYGITKDEYDMLMSRSSSCEICGSTNKLVYDHDHNKRGLEAFRGVLCDKCNRGLGFLGDNEEGLHKAYLYLNRYNSI